MTRNQTVAELKIVVPEQSAPVLNLRSGEKRYYFDTAPEQDVWNAVMLWVLPPFPGENGVKMPRFIVISAIQQQTVNEGKWRWVDVSPVAKDVIVNDLLNNGARIEKWYYLVHSGELKSSMVGQASRVAGEAEFYFTPQTPRPLKWWEPIMRWLVRKSAGI